MKNILWNGDGFMSGGRLHTCIVFTMLYHIAFSSLSFIANRSLINKNSQIGANICALSCKTKLITGQARRFVATGGFSITPLKINDRMNGAVIFYMVGPMSDLNLLSNLSGIPFLSPVDAQKAVSQGRIQADAIDANAPVRKKWPMHASVRFLPQKLKNTTFCEVHVLNVVTQ